MSDALKQAVLRHMESHGPAGSLTLAPVPGLVLVRSMAPTAAEHTLARPQVCLVLQGGQRVAIGQQVSLYEAGDMRLVTGNLPTATRITVASAAKPFLSLALDLDAAVIAELVAGTTESGAPQIPPSAPVDDTQADLRDALRRLIQLLARPQSLAVLKDALMREIHHWLLLGPRGQAIRQLGLPGGPAQRIARAVALLQADYARPLPIEQLAAAAGMRRSTFHQHFRAATTLSPLQFQRHLRLIEARRLILGKGKSSSQAASEVGYESTSQFSRGYARMFGRPPARDKEAASDTLPATPLGDEPREDDHASTWKARLRARKPGG